MVWRAADHLGYPYGPVFQLLILTGQREREVADATWDEFDLKNALWTIPKIRMKGERAHEVPLSPSAVKLLEGLPRWTRGKHLFSTTDGTKPLNGFSKAKVRIGKLVATERVKLGLETEDGAGGMPAWVIHDLRRTVRTHLSALPVQDMIRELVIAHAKPGLHRVYDQHTYRNEKSECLNLWDDRLGIILERKDMLALQPHRAARRQG
jgi:integrase